MVDDPAGLETVSRGWPCFRLVQDMIVDPAGYRVYVRGGFSILTSDRPALAPVDRAVLERLLETQRARAELTTAQTDGRTEERWKVDAALDRAAVGALERVLSRG